jgi:hypothetical protein
MLFAPPGGLTANERRGPGLRVDNTSSTTRSAALSFAFPVKCRSGWHGFLTSTRASRFHRRGELAALPARRRSCWWFEAAGNPVAPHCRGQAAAGRARADAARDFLFAIPAPYARLNGPLAITAAGTQAPQRGGAWQFTACGPSGDDVDPGALSRRQRRLRRRRRAAGIVLVGLRRRGLDRLRGLRWQRRWRAGNARNAHRNDPVLQCPVQTVRRGGQRVMNPIPQLWFPGGKSGARVTGRQAALLKW